MFLPLLCTATAYSAEEPPSEAEHLLHLADNGLAVVQLQIEVDGRSQREICREQLMTLCRHADQDRDGQLTAEEFGQGVANHPAIRGFPAPMAARPGTNPVELDFSAGPLPIEAVIEFALRRIWRPLRVEFASPQLQRINTAGAFLERPIADSEMFHRLDTDGNYKLTSRELDRAAEVLGKLDFDENEIITVEELRMQPPVNRMAANRSSGARRSDVHLSVLEPDRIDTPFVRRVLSTYDGSAKGTVKDFRLDSRELGMAPPLFAQADADENGYWDFDEIWRFLESPIVSASLRLQFSSAGNPTVVSFSIADPDAVRLIHQAPASIQFELHGTRFRLGFPRTLGPAPAMDQSLKLQFQTFDRDKNEYLTAQELNPPGVDEAIIKALFAEMDANGDEKVYFDEFQDHYKRQTSLRDSQMTLSVENLGRTLYGPLDADGDGRLSRRELAQLKDRFPEWDTDGDGRLVEDEIPLQYRLTVSRGVTGMMSVGGLTAIAPGGMPDAPAASADGPLWFRKMDRNYDGDVSPREFLGTQEQFEKIDVNGDGAIDAEEAARVK